MKNKSFDINLNSHEKFKQLENVGNINSQTKTKVQKCYNIIDIIEKKNSQTNKVHIIYFFLSELSLFFIFGLILLILYLIPQYHSAKTFISKSSIRFNSNYIPKIFIHTTDIHISSKKQNLVDGSSIFLTSLYEYKPDFF